MTYNHEAFLKKYWAATSEFEQKEMMRAYMLSLPTEELDNFMFGNIEKIKDGIESLAAKNQLNKAVRNQISQQLDNIGDKIEYFQQPAKAV
jgi:hypothetical protein